MPNPITSIRRYSAGYLVIRGDVGTVHRDRLTAGSDNLLTADEREIADLCGMVLELQERLDRPSAPIEC